MINLGLARIARLLEHTPLPWKAIHVAGTNGKGSVCAYASAMLKAANVHAGRFTSPHLIDRWDCITIDEQVVDERQFRRVEEEVKYRNHEHNIQASEFELLTATAFTVFTREKVDLAVVEVGLGGKEDATNIIQSPLATVITNISIDHQSFLGDTLEEIAAHKAGIMKPGAPCFVDGTNSSNVLDVIRRTSEQTQTGANAMIPQDREEHQRQVWKSLPMDQFLPHQRTHVALAFAAVDAALHTTRNSQEILDLIPAVQETSWPGRLQAVSIQGLTGRKEPILLDGSHNAQAARVLGSYVDHRLRQKDRSVTWVIAVSLGKDIPGLLSHLVKPEDRVVATRFGPVDGMPWVQPVDPDSVLSVARDLGVQQEKLKGSSSVLEALKIAVKMSDGAPMVIAGSLYLVSDVLRSLRERRRDESSRDVE